MDLHLGPAIAADGEHHLHGLRADECRSRRQDGIGQRGLVAPHVVLGVLKILHRPGIALHQGALAGQVLPGLVEHHFRLNHCRDGSDVEIPRGQIPEAELGQFGHELVLGLLDREVGVLALELDEQRAWLDPVAHVVKDLPHPALALAPIVTSSQPWSVPTTSTVRMTARCASGATVTGTALGAVATLGVASASRPPQPAPAANDSSTARAATLRTGTS